MSVGRKLLPGDLLARKVNGVSVIAMSASPFVKKSGRGALLDHSKIQPLNFASAAIL